MQLAAQENLEATVVATVTDRARMRMTWRGKVLVDLERAFLDTNGVTQVASARVTAPKGDYFSVKPVADVRAKCWRRLEASTAPRSGGWPSALTPPSARHRADALCREVPAHPDPGDGG